MSAPSIRRRQIYVCRRLEAVRGRPSRSNLRFSSSRIVLKSSRCHFGKNKVCRLRKAPLFGAVVIGVWPLLAPALFVCARRAKSGFESLEGAHSAGHALAV